MHTISIHAFMQTTCSATDSVSKVRRLIVGLETLRFCTDNDEKCCTLVYTMSPEIICPNLAVKESEPTVCYFLHILSICPKNIQSQTVKQLFSETTSHFVNAINCFLLASSLNQSNRIDSSLQCFSNLRRRDFKNIITQKHTYFV